MAIYHCSVSTVGRSAGRSAVAAAAYRAAEKMQDKRTGEIHDYTRKQGVKYSEIIAPKDAPAWTLERESLWNAAEAAESRKNSTVAREITVALPCELGPDARYQLAAEFAEHLSDRYGVVVDMNIHHPKKQSAKDRPKGTLNYHAHLLMTTRRITPDGFTEKTRELDVKTSGEIEHIRAAWADHANRALNNSYKGFLYGSRIDHRTLKEQGIDRVPTKHMGPAATAMERRGIKTDKGRWNRRVAALHRARNRAAREAIREERRIENNVAVYVRAQEKMETAALLAQVQKPKAPSQVMHQAHDQAQQIHAEIHAPKQPVQAQEQRRQGNAGGLGAAPPVQGAERPEAAVQQGAALPNHQPDLKAQEPKQPKKPEPRHVFKPESIKMLDSKSREQVQEQFEQRQRRAVKEQGLARFLEKRPEWQEWHQGREDYAAERRVFAQDRQADKMVRDAFKVQESALAQDWKSFDERLEKVGALERTRYAIGTGALAKEEKELAARKVALENDKRKNFDPGQLAHMQRVKEMTALARKVAAERKRAGLGGKRKANFEKEYAEFKAKAVKTWAKEVSAWDSYKTHRAQAEAAPAKVQEQPTKAPELTAQADTAKGKTTPEEKMLAEKARLLTVAEAARKAGPAQYRERMEAEKQAKAVEAAYLRTLTPYEQFQYKQRQEKAKSRGRGR